jgi:hypothetical protein
VILVAEEGEFVALVLCQVPTRELPEEEPLSDEPPPPPEQPRPRNSMVRIKAKQKIRFIKSPPLPEESSVTRRHTMQTISHDVYK